MVNYHDYAFESKGKENALGQGLPQRCNHVGLE